MGLLGILGGMVTSLVGGVRRELGNRLFAILAPAKKKAPGGSGAKADSGSKGDGGAKPSANGEPPKAPASGGIKIPDEVRAAVSDDKAPEPVNQAEGPTPS